MNLFRIWEDDSGDLQFELVSEKPLKQEYLQSGVSFKFVHDVAKIRLSWLHAIVAKKKNKDILKKKLIMLIVCFYSYFILL